MNTTKPLHPMRFTADTGLYVVSPDATANVIHDQICSRMTQFKAMLLAAHGEGGLAFRGDLTEETKDDYLATCFYLTQEVSELLRLPQYTDVKGGAS